MFYKEEEFLCGEEFHCISSCFSVNWEARKKKIQYTWCQDIQCSPSGKTTEAREAAEGGFSCVLCYMEKLKLYNQVVQHHLKKKKLERQAHVTVVQEESRLWFGVGKSQAQISCCFSVRSCNIDTSSYAHTREQTLRYCPHLLAQSVSQCFSFLNLCEV